MPREDRVSFKTELTRCSKEGEYKLISKVIDSIFVHNRRGDSKYLRRHQKEHREDHLDTEQNLVFGPKVRQHFPHHNQIRCKGANQGFILPLGSVGVIRHPGTTATLSPKHLLAFLSVQQLKISTESNKLLISGKGIAFTATWPFAVCPNKGNRRGSGKQAFRTSLNWSDSEDLIRGDSTSRTVYLKMTLPRSQSEVSVPVPNSRFLSETSKVFECFFQAFPLRSRR